MPGCEKMFMNYRLCQTPWMRKPPWSRHPVQEMKGFQRDFNKRSQALQKDYRIITVIWLSKQLTKNERVLLCEQQSTSTAQKRSYYSNKAVYCSTIDPFHFSQKQKSSNFYSNKWEMIIFVFAFALYLIVIAFPGVSKRGIAVSSYSS